MTNIADIRDVIRGALASLFGFGGRLIARAILMIFAGRAFGMEAVGLLGLVAALSEITASISVLGLKRSLLDMLSFRAENGEAPEVRIKNAIGVALTLSIVLMLIGGIAATMLTSVWPSIFPNLTHLFPYFIVAIPAYVFADVALTSIKFKRIIKWDVWARAIAEPWVFLTLSLGLYYMGYKQTGLLIAYSGSVLCAALCAAIGLFHTYGAKPLLSAKIRPSAWISILKQSAPIGITDAGVMALRRIDLAVLYIFVGPQGAGLYYMVQQLATIPQKVQGLFEPMMSPVIARLHNRQDGDGIRSNLIAVCRWIFIIQLGLTIPMVVFGDFLLSLFGPGFAVGVTVLALVLLAELIDGSFITAETALLFEKPKIPPLLLITTLIIEVTVIAILSSQWGVEGAAVGFLIAIVFLSVMRVWMLRKNLGISVLTPGFLWPAAIGVVIMAALAFVRPDFASGNGMLATLYGLMVLVAFGGLIKTFALNKSDEIIFAVLKKKKPETTS
jgi:O-antigen/teichoic acid export membrane protein